MSDPSFDNGGRSPSGRSARTVRLLLLVVVVVGAFAALWVAQREIIPRTYTLRLGVAGDEIGDTIYAAPLLDHFRVVVEIPGLEMDPIVLETPEQDEELRLSGSKRWDVVEEGGVRAWLVADVPSPVPWRIELGRFEPDGKRIVVEIDPEDDARLRREKVSTVFELLDEEGRPLEDLESATADLRSLEGGRYELEVGMDMVLFELRYETRLEIRVEGAGGAPSIDLDPLWFLGEPEGPRVVQVDTAEPDEVSLPEVESVTPARVILGQGTDQRITVTGFDLLLVDAARLVRGGRRLDLTPTRQRDGSLEFALPAGIERGSWSLELDVRDVDRPLRLEDVLEAATEFRLLRPEPFARVPFGEPLEVRWQASGGSGTVRVEIADEDLGVRWAVYEGSVGREAARFPTLASDQEEAPLAPGNYTLLLELPEESGGRTLRREFVVEEPPAVDVLLRFTRNGRPFTAYDEVQVDGVPVDLNPLRRSFRVQLPAGSHDLEVKLNSRWERHRFETTGVEDEEIVIPLD